MNIFSYYKCGIIQLISSIFLIISGIILYFLSQKILKDQLYKNIVIKNDSVAYKIWMNPTEQSTVYRKYYLFTVDNAEQLLSGEESKPRLTEKGPYVYSEVMTKKDVSFIDEETVRYAPITTLNFVANMSTGSLDDKITFFNVPAWGLIESSMKSGGSTLTAAGINMMFLGFGTKIFETKTVKELISGYKDPLLTAAKLFVPNLVKDDHFSLINNKNGTIYEHFTMNTGVNNIRDIGTLRTWDDKDKMDIWNNENANTLKGTDGTIYPPYLNKDKTIYSFNPDMCRTYTLKYFRKNKVRGVETWDFHLPENVFWNSTLNPSNEGYCQGDCLGNGVQNISKCYGGVSSFISQPHFLNADKKFTDALVGVTPDEQKHDMIMSFEPLTSVPLTASIKFMISFYYQSYPGINLIKHLKPTVIPMVWFEESIKLNDDVADQLGTVAIVAKLCTYMPIAFEVIGFICFILSLTFFWLYYKNDYKKEKKAAKDIHARFSFKNKLFESSLKINNSSEADAAEKQFENDVKKSIELDINGDS